MIDENIECEECEKIKDCVRFEGLYEGYICDTCLYEIKFDKDVRGNIK